MPGGSTASGRSAWLVAGLSLLAVWPLLLLPGYDSHDGILHWWRIAEFTHVLRAGRFPVRWLPDLMGGYGLPTFVLMPPLAYFLTFLLQTLGAGVFAAYRWTLAGTVLFSGLSLFWLARVLLRDHQAALVAAVAYMFAPYRFLDVYVRGALPESLSFVFIPLVFLGILLAWQARPSRALALLAAALAGLLLAHNAVALVIFPVGAMFALCLFWREPRLRPAAVVSGAYLLALGLSAFYWLPALLERAYTWVGTAQGALAYDFRQHFVSAWQLLSAYWNYGVSRPGSQDGMSFQVGSFAWLAVLATLAASRVLPSFLRRRVFWFWQLFFWTCVLLTTSASRFLWTHLPLLPFLQFPWRFLGFAVFASSLLSGYLVLAARQSPAWESRLAWLLFLWPTGFLALSWVGETRGGNYLAAQTAIVAALAAVLAFVWSRVNFRRDWLVPMFAAMLVSVSLPLSLLPLQARVLGRPRPPAVTERDLTPDAIRQKVYRAGATYEMLPKTVRLVPSEPPGQDAVVAEGEGRIQNVRRGVSWLSFDLQAESPVVVIVERYYFPGWTVLADGDKKEFAVDPAGRMIVQFQPGRHRVEARFGRTPVRAAAEALSLLSGLILAAWGWLVWRRHAA